MKLFKFLSKNSLLICILVLTIAFIATYPNKYISIDEHEYLTNSYRIVYGDLRQECDFDNVPGQYIKDDYCLSKYNIGTSIFFLPAVFLPRELVFIFTFLISLAGVFIFNKLLKLFNIDSFFLYLYAFYPAFIYFSRTLFSESFSVTFILLSLYSLIRSLKTQSYIWPIIAGASFGASILLRYTNVLPLGIIYIFILISSFKREEFEYLIRKLFYIFIGGFPFLLIFLVINSYLYGGMLKSGYAISKEEIFLISNLPNLFAKYSTVLLIIYPAMLISIILSKIKYKWTLFLASLVTIILYSLYPANAFEGRFLDLILPLRFVMPIIPLLLLIYCSTLNRLLKFKVIKYLLIGVFIALVIGVFGINYVHNQFLNNSPIYWPDSKSKYQG